MRWLLILSVLLAAGNAAASTDADRWAECAALYAVLVERIDDPRASRRLTDLADHAHLRSAFFARSPTTVGQRLRDDPDARDAMARRCAAMVRKANREVDAPAALPHQTPQLPEPRR